MPNDSRLASHLEMGPYSSEGAPPQFEGIYTRPLSTSRRGVDRSSGRSRKLSDAVGVGGD